MLGCATHPVAIPAAKLCTLCSQQRRCHAKLAAPRQAVCTLGRPSVATPRTLSPQVSRRLQRRLYADLRAGNVGYVQLAVETYAHLLRDSRPEKSNLLANELVVRTVVMRRRCEPGHCRLLPAGWAGGAALVRGGCLRGARCGWQASCAGWWGQALCMVLCAWGCVVQ